MKAKITGKMRKALPLLASGMAGKDVAAAIGVQESTVSHWLNHSPVFIDALDKLRDTGMRYAVVQLQCTLSTAVEELRNIMTSSKSDAVRLKAAQFVVEAYGITKERDQAYLDPVSRAELAVVGDILKGLGGSRATA